MTHRRLALSLLCGVLLATWPTSRPSAAQQHYTLRLATWGAAKAAQVESYVPLFTKLVEDGSHGRISVQDFPSGSLVGEHAVPSSIENDVADVALTLLGTWESIVPLTGIVDTVFFSPSPAKFESIVGPATPLFNALDKAMQGRGVKLLCALDNGAPVVTSNVSMTKADDFKGKTVR
ncbi:MAG: TRAP transporter substrate-binding protein, partial [Vulcanimicrobiaceae bacterium]